MDKQKEYNRDKERDNRDYGRKEDFYKKELYQMEKLILILVNIIYLWIIKKVKFSNFNK